MSWFFSLNFHLFSYNIVFADDIFFSVSCYVTNFVSHRWLIPPAMQINQSCLTTNLCSSRPGVDRLVAILCNAPTIREVIAFPKSSDGKCLMSKSPAPVTSQDMEYYHFRVIDAKIGGHSSSVNLVGSNEDSLRTTADGKPVKSWITLKSTNMKKVDIDMLKRPRYWTFKIELCHVLCFCLISELCQMILK